MNFKAGSERRVTSSSTNLLNMYDSSKPLPQTSPLRSRYFLGKMQLDFFGDETDHFLLSFFPSTRKKPHIFSQKRKIMKEIPSVISEFQKQFFSTSRNSISSLSLFLTLNSVKESSSPRFSSKKWIRQFFGSQGAFSTRSGFSLRSSKNF